MNGNDRAFTATLSALKFRGCHVSQDWLRECVNFFCSENNHYSPKDLENFVFDQWLLGDLRVIAVCGSLPPNLSNILKTTLQGKMACQIESIIDIGHSAYNQMQKVRNEDVGNVLIDENKEFQQAWEPKSNRCLQFTLSDGAQTIKAIEYKPVSSLKTEMMPGIKILLQGPIECRRGVLLLEEKHVTVLGGEVDALVIVNAYENLLARTLNLPENPDPYNITAPPTVPSIQSANQPQHQQQPQPHPPQAHQPRHLQIEAPQANAVPQRPHTGNYADHRRQQNHPTTGSRACEPAKKLVQTSLSWSKQHPRPPQANPPQTPAFEFAGNDEDFMNIPLNPAEWDEEMDFENIPTERNLHTSTVSNPGDLAAVKGSSTEVGRSRNTDRSTNAASSTAENFDDSDEFDAILLEAEASLALDEPSKPQAFALKNLGTSAPLIKKKVNEETFSSKRLASTALPEESLKKPLFAKRRKETSSQEVTSSTDLNHLIADDFLDCGDPPESSNVIPIILPSHPFVYLSQIGEMKAFNTFRVKAAVITVVEKLSISQNKWKLSAKISDGSANVDVKFSDKVLEELFGMSATAMNEMKKQVDQQPLIRKTLAKAQCRLINLNCLLDIKLCGEEMPLVVGMEDVSSSTVSALNERCTLSSS